VQSFHNPDEDHWKDSDDIKFSKEDEAQIPKIKAATIDKLIERLTYDGHPDISFMKQFLTTYRSFLKPSELMEKLILRYCVTPPMQAFMLTGSELLSIKKSKQLPIRLR
jgi:hypothetical protein